MPLPPPESNVEKLLAATLPAPLMSPAWNMSDFKLLGTIRGSQEQEEARRQANGQRYVYPAEQQLK